MKKSTVIEYPDVCEDPFAEEIITGKECPYCGNPSEYINSSYIYNGFDYGMIYICKPCKAWVGVHKDTDKAKGRLANERLRELKKQAHYYFDGLWEHAWKKHGRARNEARKSAYAWLGKELGIPPEHTHIGMFNEELCTKAMEVCMGHWMKIYGSTTFESLKRNAEI